MIFFWGKNNIWYLLGIKKINYFGILGPTRAPTRKFFGAFNLHCFFIYELSSSSPDGSETGFPDPWYDPIGSHMIYNEIHRLLHSFDRNWKARWKQIWIWWPRLSATVRRRYPTTDVTLVVQVERNVKQERMNLLKNCFFLTFLCSESTRPSHTNRLLIFSQYQIWNDSKLI